METSSQDLPGRPLRAMGIETEFGVYRPGAPGANPIVLSTMAVQAYAGLYRGARGPVGWDYRSEDPLNDVRGLRLDRASADPSLLTDDPYHLAPSGGSETLPRPSEAEQRLNRPTSIVLLNGGRYYVDHAHPEYSSPEVTNALDAVIWDRAGDQIARASMEIAAGANSPEGPPFVLVKNNVDGKGATYGAHENYQVARSADLDDLIRFLIPFLVTRPIICGAGRVGIGPASQQAGFQISQRADYVENDIGLETTFNRPIFNTRDEPHANHHLWRRIHVIGGDANQYDVSILLKTGTTALVLSAIEAGTDLSWDDLDLADPVMATREVSRDTELKVELPMRQGQSMTALEIQGRYLEIVRAYLSRSGGTPTAVERLVVDTWASVLDRLAQDPESVSTEVEWVGKLSLMRRQMARTGAEWDDPRIQALDLQWGDLRSDRSLVTHLDRAGLVKRLVTQEQIDQAALLPPADTRAKERGDAVRERNDLVQASWSSLVFDRGESGLQRVPVAEPIYQDFRPSSRPNTSDS